MSDPSVELLDKPLVLDIQKPADSSMAIDKDEKSEKEHEQILFSGNKLAIIFTAFCIAFFLVALDQTVLSTALPTIASHFDAVKDLSWIASGYFLPQAAFMLLFGKILVFTPPKIVFLASVAIFEIGSLICAVSPSIEVLILGRTISGLGATGLWVSILSITAMITSVKQRPAFMGLFGAVFAVSSIVGPIIGGAFSDHVTWRWCFYINLPVGGIAILAIVLLLPSLEPPEQSGSMLHSWLRLDWLGATLNFGFVTMLLIALQWGGNERPWNDPVVIAFLCLFAAFLISFLAWEWHMKEKALLPFEILLRRNIIGSSLTVFFSRICFVLATYYLPLLYQVRGHSATHSGVDILGFMISGIITTFAAGGISSRTGCAWPLLVFPPLVASAAFGLLFTVTDTTASNRILGFQILVGAGLGWGTQLPVVVAQAEFVNEEHLISRATSLVSFLQLIGSSVGLATSGAVFTAQLRHHLQSLAPSISQELQQEILSSVESIFTVPDNLRAIAKAAYIAAIQRVYLIGVPAAALSSITALIIRRERLKKTETNA